MVTGFLFGVTEKIWNLTLMMVHNSVNVSNALTGILKKWLKWPILCYIYFNHNKKKLKRKKGLYHAFSDLDCPRVDFKSETRI